MGLLCKGYLLKLLLFAICFAFVRVPNCCWLPPPKGELIEFCLPCTASLSPLILSGESEVVWLLLVPMLLSLLLVYIYAILTKS